jgi:diacylglycerol kinase family enzyme
MRLRAHTRTRDSLINIDGENSGQTPFTVECMPRAITMYAAPNEGD